MTVKKKKKVASILPIREAESAKFLGYLFKNDSLFDCQNSLCLYKGKLVKVVCDK